MTKDYIINNFNNIKKFENVIETRIEEDLDIQSLIKDNERALEQVKKFNINYILIDREYNVDV